MRRAAYVLPLVCAIASTSTLADCWSNSERVQLVYAHSGGTELDHWEVRSADIHRVTAANGFVVGVQIEPATPDKYRQLLKRSGVTAEFVKISLFDVQQVPPKLLSTTWGGANSFQGFGARGGANGVSELGDPGIRFTLFRPVCVTQADVTAVK
jgi:hypothetical protein